MDEILQAKLETYYKEVTEKNVESFKSKSQAFNAVTRKQLKQSRHFLGISEKIERKLAKIAEEVSILDEITISSIYQMEAIVKIKKKVGFEGTVCVYGLLEDDVQKFRQIAADNNISFLEFNWIPDCGRSSRHFKRHKAKGKKAAKEKEEAKKKKNSNWWFLRKKVLWKNMMNKKRNKKRD